MNKQTSTIVIGIIAALALALSVVALTKVGRDSDPISLPFSLEVRLDFLEAGQRDLESKMLAVLPADFRGLASVDTGSGVLFIARGEAVPYLNGYKVKLNVGNPWVARILGADIKVRTGTPRPTVDSVGFDIQKLKRARASWESGLKETDITVTEPLEPGKWISLEVLILPASSEQLGYMDVSIRVTQMTLLPTEK